MMPIRKTQNWLPSIFNDFFDNDWMVKANATAPAINVFETEKEYKIELAAPGMTKEDFNVHIDEDNNLVISMEKKSENKEEDKKDGRYLRREFSYSKFQQTMILPDDVDKEQIEAWTRFDFKGRNGKYSNFIWNESCFDGVDYDERKKRHAIYEFDGDSWDQLVDNENGNYDYLMGADVDNQAVVDELIRFGKWYLDFTNVDGFRLDAVKHIDFTFFTRWLKELRNYSNRDLFAVGEYWHGDVNKLLHYLEVSNYCMSLFDVTLHFKFHYISSSNGTFDMGSIFEDTLVKKAPDYAVTFVENHDSQPGQSLQSSVANWFKPIAYALILLRQYGYPCVFYGDYYGIPEYNVDSFKDVIDKMIKVRKELMYGKEHNYFDDNNIVGWSYEGDSQHLNSGFAVIVNDGPGGQKKMYVGKKHANETFVDCLNNVLEEIIIDKDGFGIFLVNGGSVSVWTKKF